MKKIVLLLLVLVSLGLNAQSYKSDSTGIYPLAAGLASHKFAYNTVLNFTPYGDPEQLEIRFLKANTRNIFVFTSKGNSHPDSVTNMVFYVATDSVSGIPGYIITLRFVNNELQEVGVNDGEDLTLFYIKKEEHESNNTRTK